MLAFATANDWKGALDLLARMESKGESAQLLTLRGMP